MLCINNDHLFKLRKETNDIYQKTVLVRHILKSIFVIFIVNDLLNKNDSSITSFYMRGLLYKLF